MRERDIYIYIHPGRQCWSLPPTGTMPKFWCLTCVKKSMDGPWKYKIIIHKFAIPISQPVGALELNLKPTRSYKYWFPDRKHIKEPYLHERICIVLSEFRDKTWDLKRFWKFATPGSSCYRLIWINAPRNRELSVATGRSDDPKKSLAWNSVKYPWTWNAVFTREMW